MTRNIKIKLINPIFRVTVMTPRSFPPRNTSGAFTRCIKVVTRQTPSPPSLCRIRGNTKRETNTKGITVLWISVLRAGPRGSRKNVAVVLVIQIDLGKHSHLIKSERKYSLNHSESYYLHFYVVYFHSSPLSMNERILKQNVSRSTLRHYGWGQVSPDTSPRAKNILLRATFKS